MAFFRSAMNLGYSPNAVMDGLVIKPPYCSATFMTVSSIFTNELKISDPLGSDSHG